MIGKMQGFKTKGWKGRSKARLGPWWLRALRAAQTAQGWEPKGGEQCLTCSLRSAVQAEEDLTCSQLPAPSRTKGPPKPRKSWCKSWVRFKASHLFYETRIVCSIPNCRVGLQKARTWCAGHEWGYKTALEDSWHSPQSGFWNSVHTCLTWRGRYRLVSYSPGIMQSTLKKRDHVSSCVQANPRGPPFNKVWPFSMKRHRDLKCLPSCRGLLWIRL